MTTPVNALDVRERLITAKQAAELVPVPNVGTLLDWLGKHKAQFPPRWMPWHRRYVRMLTLTEVAMIRSMRMQQAEKSRLMAEKSRRLRGKPRKRVNP